MSHDEGQRCACVSEHRPAPLEHDGHHAWPLGMGGPDTDENIVWVCPTTHRNAHELLRLLIRSGRLTYTQVADLYDVPVSRYAYALALRGYDLWMAAPVSQK